LTSIPLPAEGRADSIHNRIPLRFFNGEGHTFDLLEDLNHIECRILLLAGEDDAVTPIEDAADIAGRIPAGLLHFVRASPMLAMACSAMTGNALYEVIREFVVS
jgi:pimeloyl-ACP methyl ester carboxylesterase